MPSMEQRANKVSRIFFIGMCVDYKLPVWFIWRKDRDYFDRMQILGGKYFIAAIDGCNIDSKNEERGEKEGTQKREAG